MPSRSILERLAAGDTLLMDGGTGTELQRRGVNISKGATVEKRPTAPQRYAAAEVPGVTYRSVTGLGVWSAPANLEAPEVVRQVHEDYLKLGAEVVIACTGTHRFVQELPDGERVVELAPGEALVNPPGVWHTADSGDGGWIVTITPGLDTEHRPR